ncbi:Peptidoglycan/LPS O-acetylase OafA/YrhL, contains acyltransferase and SGNH-hydrolase domains [Nonomuraea maritima]|uniref:Peptidoglycan/LPS O-acetylase OafA/YrhL, contains acyltransferase and SGNH-hydrolase domains n=1 Tax=Nonomuraea maritima TaxID=683260 RepID=A0A1G8S6Y9_9ACTN|nr:acyltransferase [Nonomuraea maritima]SDJ24967.1 Peptidoglycan/LPS O-acetylase OafA/YrhL, contains acyltransferase and SGNH-hydrolase domains [Nonomuraea maritima]
MSPTPARLAWLDALRGPAALAVTLHHAGWSFVPGLWAVVDGRIDVGTWGVFVFFLVSGYIIPASLERRGDLRAFWTGRAFRLLPLLLAAFGLVLVLTWVGALPPPGLADRPPPLVAFGNLAMLQELLNLPALINVTWTLSYEMAFYLMCVGLFAVRSEQRSAVIATGLAVAAVPLGLLLPRATIGGRADLAAALLGLAVMAAVAATVLGRDRVRMVAAVGGGLLGVALVVLGSRGGTWQGVIILATMFAGTAVYRAEQGTIPWRHAFLAVAAVLACGLPAKDDPGWAPALLLAFAAFAAAFALRGREFPRPLPQLGVISFSLYLLHPILLHVVPNLALFYAVLIPLSVVTYVLIEAPGRRIGGRLIRRTAG